MKIALINGSPKRKESSSGLLLEKFMALVGGDDHQIYALHFYQPQVSREDVALLKDCDALVWAFPLYVDGIPSHLLPCLRQLEGAFRAPAEKEIMVYSIVNCGFYEAVHNGLAIAMMQNWTERAGLKWGQGLAIGAGGMLPELKRIPLGYGPFKKLAPAFADLADHVLNRSSGETLFFTPAFPRFLYKLAGEIGWRQSAKANGLKRKDLFSSFYLRRG